jgi:hypothetical protein
MPTNAPTPAPNRRPDGSIVLDYRKPEPSPPPPVYPIPSTTTVQRAPILGVDVPMTVESMTAIDEAQTALSRSIEVAHAKYVESVLANREEILRAFVAKYGFEPDEAIQVIQQTDMGLRWWVEKREKPA